MSDQVLMGVGTALLCVIGLRYEAVLLAESERLKWLRERLGDESATWLMRIGLLFGITFGTLLAAGVIRPLYAYEAPSADSTPITSLA